MHAPARQAAAADKHPTLLYALTRSCPCSLHFATNLGVAGGLLLLASFGAGRFTVDALLNKKKE